MTSRRYRMSTIERAETLLQLLDLEDSFHATRPLGYAFTRTVDIEYPEDVPPDKLVQALDPQARLDGTYPDS